MKFESKRLHYWFLIAKILHQIVKKYTGYKNIWISSKQLINAFISFHLMINFFYTFFFLFLTHSLASSLALLLCSFHIIYFNQKIFAFRGKVLFLCFFPNSQFFLKKNFPLKCRRNYFQSWWYVWREHKWGPIMKMLEMSCTLVKKTFFSWDWKFFNFVLLSTVWMCASENIITFSSKLVWVSQKKILFCVWVWYSTLKSCVSNLEKYFCATF